MNYINHINLVYNLIEYKKIFFFKINNIANMNYKDMKLYFPLLLNNCLNNYVYRESYINFNNYTIYNSYYTDCGRFEIFFKCKLNRFYFNNPEILNILETINTPKKYKQYYIFNNNFFNLKNYSDFNKMNDSYIVVDNETKSNLINIFKKRFIEVWTINFIIILPFIIINKNI